MNIVMKSKLPSMWQSNPTSWHNRHFFVEWVYETFSPQVIEYLMEKQLPLSCLQVMDNGTSHYLLVMDTIAHPQDLDDDLPDGFDFIKVKLLPLIQHLFSSL